MDVNDPQGFGQKLANERQRLQNAGLDDRDREAIERHAAKLRAEDKAESTVMKRLSNLRLAGQRGPRPLVEYGLDDYTELVGALRGEYGLGGGTVAQYKVALRVFYRFLHRHDDYSEYGWHEEIDISSSRSRGDGGRDYGRLTRPAIEVLKDACANQRDRALVSFLYDTGVRVGLAASLRVGDLSELDSDRPTFTPNPDASGLKGTAVQAYPLYFSAHELRQWVRKDHPAGGTDAAPLFSRLPANFDHDSPAKNALHTTYLESRLGDLGEQAGLDVPTNPHSFRHSCVARLLDQGYTRQDLKARLAWEPSAVDELAARYDERSREDELSRLDELEGREVDRSDGADGEGERTVACPVCGTMAPAAARFCPACASPLEERDRLAAERAESSVRATLARLGPERAESLVEVVERIEDSPELRAAFLDGGD